MIATSFLTGMALCAVAFLLIRADETRMISTTNARIRLQALQTGVRFGNVAHGRNLRLGPL